MASSPLRGALLIALAAIIGFLLLRGLPDNEQVPLSASQAAVPTAVAQVPEATPTPGTIAVEPVPVDTSNARPNSQVSVLVANGTDRSGQAGRLTDTLRNQGFQTRQPKNADTRASSVIYYRPGFEAEAAIVREVLNTGTPIAPMPNPDPIAGEGIDLGNVNVFVWVGADSLSTS